MKTTEALRLAEQDEKLCAICCSTPVFAPELRRLHEVNQELVEALKAYLPFIPITSAKEGGASAFSENVRAADMFRAALAKATGGQS